METLPALPEYQVEALISQALEQKVPVEALERLLAMRRELRAEWAKAEFDQEMALFQLECPIIKKTKAVPTQRGTIGYRYAPIESIISQVKELLSLHGFSYAIKTETLEFNVRATCIAKHKGGHSESSSFEVPLGLKTAMMNDSQHVAAALTFAKRYAFCNAFGILTGESDNDGSTPIFAINEEQVAEIRSLLVQTNHTEEEMLRSCKRERVEELDEGQVVRIIRALKAAL